MKVLQVNTVCGKGSTGRIVADLAKMLEEQGHACKIAFGRYESIGDADSVRIETDLGNRLHALKTRAFDRQGFSSIRATKRLISEIREYSPDIIHLHNLHGNYLNVELLFSFLSESNIPIVWTLHDCWPYTGHCVYSDYIGCEKWKTGCYDCPKKREYPKSVFLDNSRKNYADKKRLFTSLRNLTLVTVSDWLKSQVEMSFLSKYNIVRIYNGIDLDVFRPVKNDIREKLNIGDKYMILGVSDGWSERKGVDYFIKLASDLGEDEALVMVGMTEKETKRMPHNVICLRRTDSVEELVQLYSAADVVLNPSFEETFGLVTAEALSCGTPVIVSNATASPELVDETCGMVVEKGDYAKIKEALTYIKYGNISSEACLNRAEIFDKNRNYRLYIDLYERVLRR